MDASIIAVLLAWAVNLTGYPAPAHPPTVQYEPHHFFVAHACGERDCDAVGWYNDRGVIYLDNRLRGRDDVFARSVAFHEFVHYVQDESGQFDTASCDDQVAREKEAYALQRSFVARAFGQVAFIQRHHRGC